MPTRIHVTTESLQPSAERWDSMYTTFRDASSTFLTFETDSQILSFDEVAKDLSISNGNTVSLSALINGTTVDTEVRALTSNWQDAFTITQSNSATTLDVVSDVAVGSIDAGDVVLKGTNLQNFVEQLLLKTFYPTFTNPSASTTSNLASTVESGTTGITLTVNLNRGAITGKSVGGIWQPSTFQDYRSGTAFNYIINGSNNGTANSLVSSTAVIQDGSNVFSSIVSYASGAQPVDSKGANYLTPLLSGTLVSSVTVTGRRRAFYGLNSLGLNSNDIRNLQYSLLNPVNGSTFTINITSGTTSVLFAYPASLRDVSEVKYVEGLGSDVKANFTKTTFNVDGANSYAGTSYKIYNYTPTGVGGVPVPFSQAVTYIVTI